MRHNFVTLQMISTTVLLMTFPLWANFAVAQDRTLVLASTTSTQNSGLYDYLLPHFTAATGIRVRVVAVGTGQALRIAQGGDADLLIVHHRPSENAFISKGFGLSRQDLMYNDFVLVGPADDPAGVAASISASDALSRLARAQSLFISRADESGTHLKELELWRKAGLRPGGAWYVEIGAGMGAALNMAAARDGYVLTDRGTWLSFRNPGQLRILFQGDAVLRNPYSVIVVNPAKHPHIRIAEAQTLADWLTSPRGQRLIGAFQIDRVMLFCPVLPPPDSAANGGIICVADALN